jgi:multidrug efflux pump subunit AcrA (membrane-fusion protein)
MLTRLLPILLLSPLVTLAVGCKCPCAQCGVPRTPCAPCAYSTCECKSPPPNLAAEIPVEWIPQPLPAPSETYELLEASSAQCNAATNAAVANMVELERHWAQVIIQCDTKGVAENYCLDRDLMSLHACAIRNDAAADALTAFYQLAGLEAQSHYLNHALHEVEKTYNRVQKLREAGLAVPEGLDRAIVGKQYRELEDRLAQLDMQRLQLNGQLQTLVGCPLNEHKFFWPHMDWQPLLETVDVEAELTLGLSNRQELRGLGIVLCNMEKVTLPMTRGVLKFADPTIGSVEPQDGIIHVIRCSHCNDHEVPVRCRQLELFYEDTEAKTSAEIKNAAYKIGLQQNRIVLAQETVLDLRKRVGELEKTRDSEDVAIFEISSARTDLDQAEADLIQQIIDLKLAQVQLKKAQGMLANECGFPPQLCLEGCCDGACTRCEGGHSGNCECTRCMSCATGKPCATCK